MRIIMLSLSLYVIGSLDVHLSRNSVEYIQFAFRWMNNLLMREFPMRCVVRLWDSYLVRTVTWRQTDMHDHTPFLFFFAVWKGWVCHFPCVRLCSSAGSLLTANQSKQRFSGMCVLCTKWNGCALIWTVVPVQDIMVFLQNLPTAKWSNDDIELLLAEAFKLKFMFADAPGHLTVQRTS